MKSNNWEYLRTLIRISLSKEFNWSWKGSGNSVKRPFLELIKFFQTTISFWTFWQRPLNDSKFLSSSDSRSHWNSLTTSFKGLTNCFCQSTTPQPFKNMFHFILSSWPWPIWILMIIRKLKMTLWASKMPLETFVKIVSLTYWIIDWIRLEDWSLVFLIAILNNLIIAYREYWYIGSIKEMS